MTQRKVVALVLLVALAAVAGTGCSTPGNCLFSVGMRQIEEDYWAPVEDQTLFGFTVCLEPEGSPVGIEFGGSVSVDYETVFIFDFTGVVTEWSVGARYTLDLGDAPVRPYIGGGLSLVDAGLDVSPGGTLDDSAVGFYVHGGVYIETPSSLCIGFDVRYTLGTDLTPGVVEVDADGLAVALTLGWAWQ